MGARPWWRTAVCAAFVAFGVVLHLVAFVLQPLQYRPDPPLRSQSSGPPSTAGHPVDRETTLFSPGFLAAVQSHGRALLGAITCPDSRPVLCTDSYGNYCVQAPDAWDMEGGEDQSDDKIVCQQQNDCGVHCQNDCKVDSNWVVDYESHACVVKTTDPGYEVLQRKKYGGGSVQGLCSLKTQEIPKQCTSDAECGPTEDDPDGFGGKCVKKMQYAECHGGGENDGEDCSNNLDNYCDIRCEVSKLPDRVDQEICKGDPTRLQTVRGGAQKHIPAFDCWKHVAPLPAESMCNDHFPERHNGDHPVQMETPHLGTCTGVASHIKCDCDDACPGDATCQHIFRPVCDHSPPDWGETATALGETVDGASDGTIDGDLTIRYDALAWVPEKCRLTSTLTGWTRQPVDPTARTDHVNVIPMFVANDKGRRGFSGVYSITGMPVTGELQDEPHFRVPEYKGEGTCTLGGEPACPRVPVPGLKYVVDLIVAEHEPVTSCASCDALAHHFRGQGCTVKSVICEKYTYYHNTVTGEWHAATDSRRACGEGGLPPAGTCETTEFSEASKKPPRYGGGDSSAENDWRWPPDRRYGAKPYEHCTKAQRTGSRLCEDAAQERRDRWEEPNQLVVKRPSGCSKAAKGPSSTWRLIQYRWSLIGGFWATIFGGIFFYFFVGLCGECDRRAKMRMKAEESKEMEHLLHHDAHSWERKKKKKKKVGVKK